jgi:peptidoglycan/xylan/chitin deacetylase (PgdA/CDA1 family)
MSHTIPVLLYHSVTDGPVADRFTVSRKTFEAHVIAMVDSGRETLGISELATAMRSERPFTRHAMAITFDDGFSDTYHTVHCLLEQGLQSTVYVISGELGTPNRLNRAQVAELAEVPGIEVGAHTVHHYYLDELPDHEIAEETRVARHQLESITQTRIRSFAYPHGAYSQRVRDAVIDAGYESAVAVKNALSHASDDTFAIARWTVTANTTASRIAEVLNGESIPHAWGRERIRTRAYRTARCGRRRLAGMFGGGR